MNSNLQKIKVVAGIVFYEKKILITKRPLNVHMGGKWEFPGGKVEKDESDSEALRRELNEELSIDVIVNKLLLETKHTYQNFEVDLFFYECHVSSNKVSNNFVLEHKWIFPLELKNYSFPPANKKIKSLILESC
tara:strand:- start:67 stop:468 length:402 start_codon:yes stop_codon:yes gene_type:complete